MWMGQVVVRRPLVERHRRIRSRGRGQAGLGLDLVGLVVWVQWRDGVRGKR